MGHLFSSHKKATPSRVTQHDEAVLQLKSQRDKLRMYSRKLEAGLEKERLLAKRLVSEGKKDKALSLLKKKRYQETLIERTTKQQANIEQMIHDMEFAQVEMEVLDKLKIGNEALHKIHTLVSVEDAERIMDETRDAVEYQQEIDRLVSGELSSQDVAEAEAELAQLLLDNGVLDQLPEAPTDRLPSPEKEASEKPRRSKDKPQLVAA